MGVARLLSDSLLSLHDNNDDIEEDWDDIMIEKWVQAEKKENWCDATWMALAGLTILTS